MKKNALRTAAVSMLSVLAFGCVKDSPPFDPVALQQDERQQSTEFRARRMKPLPTTLESPYLSPNEYNGSAAPLPNPNQSAAEPHYEDGSIRMSLQEIIHRAAINSLDIRVASYDTAVDETRVLEAEGHFDPTFFSDAQYQFVNKQTAGGSLSSVASVITNFDQESLATYDVGIRQNLESGAQAELKETVTYSFYNPQRYQLLQFYQNDLQLQITQPLLQNFGYDANRARMNIARDNQRVSLLDFRKTAEETVFDIEKAYWQLVQAERDVHSDENLLARNDRMADVLARRTREDTTRVQVSQANAELETHRATLVRARAKLGDLSDQLKRLMNDPDYPVSSPVLILPATPAMEDPVHFNLDDLIDQGLANRLELGQQDFRIDAASIAERAAKNNLLPKLDLQGTIVEDGLGRALGDAFNNQGNFNHTGFGLSLQLEVPIGNRAAEAIWRRALLQRQQAVDSYRQLISQVAFDVKTALREVDTSWNEVRATRVARFAQADALHALQQREDNNEPLTPEFVQLKLDAQQRLSEAELAEDNAVYNYNIAIAALERAKGTLLRYNNIMLQEEPIPFGETRLHPKVIPIPTPEDMPAIQMPISTPDSVPAKKLFIPMPVAVPSAPQPSTQP